MKKNVYWFIAIFVVSFVFSSCKAKQSVVVTDKGIGYEELVQSPIEKLALQSSHEEFRAYGTGESPKEQLARNIALTQARGALQATIQTNVKSALKQYMRQIETMGNTEFGNLDIETNDLVENATKGILEGSIVKDTRKLYNSKTGMYKYEVCVAYSKYSILEAIEQQDQRIMKLRKEFEREMQDSWDELDRANGLTPIQEEKTARANELEQQNKDRENQREIERLNAEAEATAKINASLPPMAPSANPTYLYTISKDGKNYGPYTYQQLQQMVPTRQITPDTYIWREGMTTWSLVKSMPELSNLFTPISAPAPVPVN